MRDLSPDVLLWILVSALQFFSIWIWMIALEGWWEVCIITDDAVIQTRTGMGGF